MGSAIAVHANLAKPADVQRLFADAERAFGRIDILVNNAGIYEFKPLEEISPEHFHKQFDLNVLGLILASQEAARYFGSDGGSIINISSVAATGAPPTTSVYSATKAAVDAVTKSLAKELGPRKIRVNSINPGMVVTEGVPLDGNPGERIPQQRRIANSARPNRPAAGYRARRRCSSRPTMRAGSPAKRSISPADSGKVVRERVARALAALTTVSPTSARARNVAILEKHRPAC